MDLATLTAAARQAATQYEHLERSTVEARREQAVEYGRALSQIRQLIPGDRAFAQHLDANGLTVRDRTWRSAAMWLAGQVDGAVISLHLCPYANPVDIRTWQRRQDPNYKPSGKSTKAGTSNATTGVREHVRPLVEAGEAISVADVVQATGKSRIVVEAAIAAERGRVEGIAEAPVDVLQLAEALGLGQKAKDRLSALIRRQEREYAVRVDDEVTRRVRKHVAEVLDPLYQSKLTEADRRLERMSRGKPVMSKGEYRSLMWALHEDQTDVKRRAEAFGIVRDLRVVLGGAEPEDLKPRTLPSTVEELLARRKRPMPGFRARA
jgi:hypothetical protein